MTIRISSSDPLVQQALRRGRRKSRAVDVETQCRALGLPIPEREFYFAKPRRWRFDWAFPEHKIALEQEGVVYPTKKGDHRLGGRHVSVKGFRQDLEKYGEAAALGWVVIRALPAQIASGEAMSWVERAMNGGRISGTRPVLEAPGRAPHHATRNGAAQGHG